MYIEGNGNQQNSQKVENCSKWVIQPSLLHDKLHVTEKFFLNMLSYLYKMAVKDILV